MRHATDWPALLQTGAETTLAVSALIVFVLIVRRPFAKAFGAKMAYALWALPLIRLALPPLPAGLSPFNWSLARSAQETVVTVERSVGEAPAPAEAATTKIVTYGEFTHEAAAAPTAEIATLPATFIVESGPAAASLTSLMTSLTLPIIAVWITGALIFLALHFSRQTTFARLVRAEAHPVSPTLHALGEDMRHELGLKRAVPLKTSLISDGPMVTGALRPVILLPEWFETDFTIEEQRLAVLHEMTHLKRRDLWTLHLALIGLALQWFNPLAHIALRAFRSDQEAACDADVLGTGSSTPKTYGSTIIKAVRLARPGGQAALAANLTMTNAIKERLVLMQNPAPTRARRLSGSAIALIIAAGGLAITASTGTAQTVLYGGDEEEQYKEGQAQADGDEDSQVTYGKYDSDEHMDVHTDVHTDVHVHTDGQAHSDEHHFYVNGTYDDWLKDRQMVLLGDPFADLEPRLAQLDHMNFPEMVLDMPEFFVDLSVLEMPTPPTPPFPPNMTHIVTEKTEHGMRITIPSQNFEFNGDMDAFEAQMEVFEDQMDVFSDMMEARSDAIELAIEARTDVFEDEMEAWSEQFEAQMETHMEGFEDEIEDASDVVEELSDDCSDLAFRDGQPVILTARSDHDGKIYRALCVKGDHDNVKSEEIRVYITNHSGLTDQEKAFFFDNRDTRFYYNFND
ncbi:MAG: M56 family metallopeptidase [Hyphomonadaceae bacterium]